MIQILNASGNTTNLSQWHSKIWIDTIRSIESVTENSFFFTRICVVLSLPGRLLNFHLLNMTVLRITTVLFKVWMKNLSITEERSEFCNSFECNNFVVTIMTNWSKFWNWRHWWGTIRFQKKSKNLKMKAKLLKSDRRTTNKEKWHRHGLSIYLN